MSIEHAIIIVMSAAFWGAASLAILYHCRLQRLRAEIVEVRRALLRVVADYATRDEGFVPETEDGPLTQREPMRAAP